MPETTRADARSGAPLTATPSRIEPAEMWENLCRADELLEECESLADARAASSPEFTTPAEKAPR